MRQQSFCSEHHDLQSLFKFRTFSGLVSWMKVLPSYFFDRRNVNRPSKYYNLDVILSVGYRVNSKRGTIYRRWATCVLRQYML